MIYSKGNLLAVEIAKDGKARPELQHVHFAPDGSTVGANEKVVLIVGPVAQQVAEAAAGPLQAEGGNLPPSDRGLTVPVGTVAEVLRNIPRDAQFHGILEHTAVTLEGDTAVFQTTDGKRRKQISGRVFPRPYVKYKEIAARYLNGEPKARFAVNLKRLISLLRVLESIASDSSSEVPIYIEATAEGDMVLRTVDRRTGQRVLALTSTYKGAEGAWLERDEWEQIFTAAKTDTAAPPVRPGPRRRRRLDTD